MIKKLMEKKLKGPEKILLAAEQVFAEKGAEGATIDEIVKAAGINKALLYYHFKNKDEILKALIHQNLEVIMAMMPEFTDVSLPTPQDVIRHTVTRMFEFFASRRQILKILIIELIRMGSSDTSILQIFKPVNDFFYHRLKSRGLISIDQKDFELKQFFLNITPFIMFQALGDKWIEYNGLDKAETERKYLEYHIENIVLNLSGSMK